MDGFTGATAKALMTIHDKTEVSLAEKASVTGDTVTINSSHEHINLVSTANGYRLRRAWYSKCRGES